MKAIYPNTTIDTLLSEGLISVRACKGLTNASLFTVSDVIQYVHQGNDLRDLPGCGRKCFIEVENILLMCYMDPCPEETKETKDPFELLQSPLNNHYGI